jgi:hypothetical protein
LYRVQQSYALPYTRCGEAGGGGKWVGPPSKAEVLVLDDEDNNINGNDNSNINT